MRTSEGYTTPPGTRHRLLSPWAFLLASALALGACTTNTTKRLGLPALQTVPKVDLKRYLGTWYEIAAFPQRFQKGCVASTATYSLRKDGQIKVVNRCRDRSLTGKLRTAKGRARVVDRKSNAKLKVTFFWPFWGDYWIIDLGPKYEYAVVGHPGRDYLWILGRKPTMDPKVFAGILKRLRRQKYQLGRLRRTLQVTGRPKPPTDRPARGEHGSM